MGGGGWHTAPGGGLAGTGSGTQCPPGRAGERGEGRLTLPVAGERSARPGTGAELIESGSAALWVHGGANEALMGWGGARGGSNVFKNR